MIISSEEMKRKLGRISATMEVLGHDQHLQRTIFKRSVPELLSMNSGDMAFGYSKRRTVMNQAVRNHGKLIAAIILKVLLNTRNDPMANEDMTISWTALKEERPWKKHTVRRNKVTIERLDKFLYNQMLHHGSSLHGWLNSSENWSLVPISDGLEDQSDLEYDDSETQILPTRLCTSIQKPRHKTIHRIRTLFRRKFSKGQLTKQSKNFKK